MIDLTKWFKNIYFVPAYLLFLKIFVFFRSMIYAEMLTIPPETNLGWIDVNQGAGNVFGHDLFLPK